MTDSLPFRMPCLAEPDPIAPSADPPPAHGALQLATRHWTGQESIRPIKKDKRGKTLASSMVQPRKAGLCMRLLQGDCCKPRVSHQSPPSTRFQPPRVKSDTINLPDQGPPPRRGSPQSGLSGPHAWDLTKVVEEHPQGPAIRRERGELVRMAGQRIKEGRERERGESSQMSDFDNPKWV